MAREIPLMTRHGDLRTTRPDSSQPSLGTARISLLLLSATSPSEALALRCVYAATPFLGKVRKFLSNGAQVAALPIYFSCEFIHGHMRF
jgi:hypothetical protein